MTINEAELISSVEEKLISITLDLEPKFEKRITGVCNKASQKASVLSKITGYTSLNKQKQELL